MKINIKNKAMAFLLTFIMVFSLVPANLPLYAEEMPETIETEDWIEHETQEIEVLESATAALLQPGDIDSVLSPSNAIIDNENRIVTATVYGDSVTVDIEVYIGNAPLTSSWGLYADSGCQEEITDKTLQLETGENTAYIMTQWESDMTSDSFIYTLIITKSTEIIGSTNLEKAQSIVSQMSFEEMFGQMLFVDPGSQVVLNTNTKNLIEKYNFGGLCLFGANVNGTLEQAVTLTHEMQETSVGSSRFNIPLILSIDQEGGRIVRFGAASTSAFMATTMPGNMAIGATADPKLAYENGKILGAEAYAVGFNMDFAPSLDVNINPDNPVIGDRSFSSDPNLVAELGVQYIRGMQDAGVLAAGKHFPGHGNTGTDTHIELSLVPGTKEELLASDLVPFQAAIDDGIGMIMTAHVTVPGLDDTEVTSTISGNTFTIPATLSKKILTDLLRDEMGFEGLIVTDAMNMAALSNNFHPIDMVEMAILAGVDLPLMPFPTTFPFNDANVGAMFNGIKERAEENPELMARIEESVIRILVYKMDMGIYEPDAGENQPALEKSLDEKKTVAAATVRSAAHLALEQEASDKAISLAVNEIIDGKAVLPFELQAGDSVFILTPAAVDGRVTNLVKGMNKFINDAGLSGQVTVTSSTYSTTRGSGFTAAHRTAIDNATYVLIGSAVTNGATRNPATNGQAGNALDIWNYIRDNGYGAKSAGLSLGLPYELSFLEYCSAMLNINTRANSNVANNVNVEYTVPIFNSVIAAAFGGLNPTGKYPVDVPHPTEAGAFIRRVGDSLSYEAQPASCDVTAVTTPADATISGLDITAAVLFKTTTLTVDVSVSQDATWALFSDSECTAEIANKRMNLAVGDNTAYIKVTAADGVTAKIYILTITRNPAEPPIIVGETYQEKAESIISQMTFEEIFGQMLFVDPGSQVSLTANTKNLIEKYNFGGLCLFGANVNGTLEQAVTLTHDMQTTSVESNRFNIPLILSIDQEGGRIVRFGAASTSAFMATTMPGNMAVGATADPQLAYENGKVLGAEAYAIGFNMDFAPSLDVNINPDNPVIGDRSFSSDPNLVAELGVQYIRGMQDAGVLAAGKHFPGHGNTGTDTHIELSLVPGTKEELLANDLLPFQAAIDDGIGMIMTAHVTVPGLDDTEVTGTISGNTFTIPATLSKKILTDLLRDEMGFEGLIVTDAMNMAALSNNFHPIDMVEMAILAGVDLPLMPFPTTFPFNDTNAGNMIQTIKERAEDNPELMARIQDSATRILIYKMEMGIYNPDAGENQACLEKPLDEKLANAKAVVRSADHLAMEQEISDKAITLAVNETINGKAVLPFELQAGDSVFILTPAAVDGRVTNLVKGMNKFINDAGLSGQVTVTSSTYSTTRGSGFTDAHRAAIDSATYVLIGSAVTNGATRNPATNGQAGNALDIWNYIRDNGYGAKTAGLSLGLPYELSFLEYCSAMLNINTRANSNVANNVNVEYTVPIYNSVIAAAFGGLSPTGKYPVDVPHPTEAGAFIRQVGDSLTYEPAVAVENVKINGLALQTVDIGKELHLTATVSPINATLTGVTWVSHNEAVATIDENGVLIGVGTGMVAIQAIAHNGVNATIMVRVF